MSNRWKGGFIQAYFDPLTVGPALPFGAIYTWGEGADGRLGLDDSIDRSSPVQVGALTTWSQSSAGNEQTTAVKTDNSLWTWGNNSAGQQGNESRTNVSSPIQVGALTTWAQVSTGIANFFMAVKTDGTMWACGQGLYGRLGTNSQTPRSSPVQVTNQSNWAQVSAGERHGAAIKTTGTLWTWGDNAHGKLGLSTDPTVDRSSPTQVGALVNWSQVVAGRYHTAAIKTDGTLWTWGDNAYGQLGLNTPTGEDRSSPVQVGALTNWSQVSASSSSTAAVKTDGTLWIWGSGANGKQGQNNTTTYSSPVQIGSLNTWAQVSCGFFHTAAVKTDGTLWTWGDNVRGQLGNDLMTDVSSPIQIGSLTTWLQASAGEFHTVAVEKS